MKQVTHRDGDRSAQGNFRKRKRKAQGAMPDSLGRGFCGLNKQDFVPGGRVVIEIGNAASGRNILFTGSAVIAQDDQTGGLIAGGQRRGSAQGRRVEIVSPRRSEGSSFRLGPKSSFDGEAGLALIETRGRFMPQSQKRRGGRQHLRERQSDN